MKSSSIRSMVFLSFSWSISLLFNVSMPRCAPIICPARELVVSVSPPSFTISINIFSKELCFIFCDAYSAMGIESTTYPVGVYFFVDQKSEYSVIDCKAQQFYLLPVNLEVLYKFF